MADEYKLNEQIKGDLQADESEEQREISELIWRPLDLTRVSSLQKQRAISSKLKWPRFTVNSRLGHRLMRRVTDPKTVRFVSFFLFLTLQYNVTDAGSIFTLV